MSRIAGWLCGEGALRLSESDEWIREGTVTGISQLRPFEKWVEFTVTFRGRPYLLGEQTSAPLNQETDFIGTAPCYARVQFALDADSTAIELDCGGDALRMEGVFSAGEAFAVDFERGAVYRSGQAANHLIAVSSRFFGIAPGSRTLSLRRKTDGVWQPLSGQCSYRPRWYA